jgi:hypothetical protein
VPTASRHAILLAGILAGALPAAALPPDGAGMAAVAVELSNTGAAAVTCHAEIAHWFAADLARIAPGQSGTLDLWRDPATGTYATRNARGEFMPVERVWCGLEGQAYRTRWLLALPQPAPARMTLSCAAEAGRLACR